MGKFTTEYIRSDNLSYLVQLQPYDEHNQKLESFVHPPDWVNPDPSGRYNLVVIGAGHAGLVTAIGAAGLGAKVALVERELMGGDCLNTGCVPSKALIRSGRIAQYLRRSEEFGLAQVPVAVNFPKVMDRVHSVIDTIAPHDSVERFTQLGVDCVQGDARIVSPWEVELSHRAPSRPASCPRSGRSSSPSPARRAGAASCACCSAPSLRERSTFA